jgi:ADP-ribosylglycohydrolase/tyrosine-protein phosphatase YwqE
VSLKEKVGALKMDKNIWLDGMMGLVVGDALGVPVQFMSREKIAGRPEGKVTQMEAGGVYDMPKGTWSDDSSMAIATLASILECGVIAPENVMTNFSLWEVKGEFTPFGEAFDQGNTCTEAIYNFLNNADVMTCGKTGEYANGNGALMRILPVCLYYYEMQDKSSIDISKDAINGIDMISGLTHNHARSKMACGLYYFMVCAILNEDNKGLKLIEVLQKGIDNGLKYYGNDMKNLTQMAHFGRLFHLDEFKAVSQKDIKSSGYVIDSIEAAVWCLIQTDSYRECMEMAVNLGDDTDTVAAIAGGLAGLYYGYNNIPEEWLCEIQKREWIEELCEKARNEAVGIDVPICDIHVHLIPGVDDGSESIDMSMEMLHSMYLQGVRKVFCTSHGGVFFKKEHTKTAYKGYDELVKRCGKELPNMEVYFGAEVRMLPEYVDRIIEMLNDGTMPTLADSEYVLAEYVNNYMDFEDMESSLDRLLSEGYIPIIAHMERYYNLVPDIEAAKKLHDKGCYIQINAYSVYGESSKAIRKWTDELLEAGIVDFIGSDAHRTYHRPPMLLQGVKELYRRYDKEYIDKMVFGNVEELILGRQNDLY